MIIIIGMKLEGRLGPFFVFMLLCTIVVKFAFETFQVWTESSAVGACQLVDRLKSILTSIFAVHNTLQRWCQSSQGEIFNEL